MAEPDAKYSEEIKHEAWQRELDRLLAKAKRKRQVSGEPMEDKGA